MYGRGRNTEELVYPTFGVDTSIRSSSSISLIVLYRKSIVKRSIPLWVYDVMTLTHQNETVYEMLSLSP